VRYFECSAVKFGESQSAVLHQPCTFDVITHFLYYGNDFTLMICVLGAFAKLRKATVSFVMSVCLSARMEQLGSHWTDFHEILNSSIFRKSVAEVQVSLKCCKNNGHFT
jgi:hypothetical protein